MKITLLAVGKTDDRQIADLIHVYQSRLQHYVNFDFEIIPDLKKTKNLSVDQQKNLEGDLILSKVNTSDFVTLLDEKGKTYTSLQFAKLINKRSISGMKRLIFVIGVLWDDGNICILILMGYLIDYGCFSRSCTAGNS